MSLRHRNEHDYSLADEQIWQAARVSCFILRGLGVKLHNSRADVPTSDEVYAHLSELANLAIDDQLASQRKYPSADVRGEAADDLFIVQSTLHTRTDNVSVDVFLKIA